MSDDPPGSSPKRTYVVAGIGALAVALVGGMLTDLGPWYHELRQPAWKPPDWAFGPIWAAILTLWALAAARSWRAASTPQLQKDIVVAFTICGVLNIAWSALFFRIERPDLALLEAGLLALSVLCLITMTWRLDRRASLMLVPYLIWVGTAAALNWKVVELNRPF